MSAESTLTLVLDPTACTGRGLCHEAAAHLIGLDEWGYPLLPGHALRAELTPSQVQPAQEATLACPRLALHIERKRR